MLSALVLLCQLPGPALSSATSLKSIPSVAIRVGYYVSRKASGGSHGWVQSVFVSLIGLHEPD